MVFQFDTRDPLLDLKLAIWETQLEEHYPNSTLQARFDQVHNLAQVKVTFDNDGDRLHWQLSCANSNNQMPGWLTLSQFVLNCENEKHTRNLCEH